MVEQSKDLTRKLLDLMQETGYPVVQYNGQRKYGPPPDWNSAPPQRGTEVFIGKLPREIFEDELVPIFSKVGRIYEMRLMMDFSGSNRGYAFVTYTTKSEAYRAVKELNGYEIRPRRCIGVVKSVDNCRLFVGCIPKEKSKEEVHEELSKKVTGIVDVILYKNCFDRNFNRGFAFVEFVSHRAAAMARRALVPGCVKLWNQEVTVDWAEPEPEVNDEQMKLVKVLYVRNFMITTSPDKIKSMFEAAVGTQLERIKKIYDYAFIHFYERGHAELAMQKLQNAEIDGINIEIRWAKPVDSELYHIQKRSRGNSKFNNIEHSQTLWLYKQHLQKQEYANSPKEDEGFGSTYAGSLAASPTDLVPETRVTQTAVKDNYQLPPAKLDSICKRFQWALPVYEYQKYIDTRGVELWVGKVDLPHVGLPLLANSRRIGPIVTGACYSLQQAHIEAAINALRAIQMFRSDVLQQSSATPMAPMYPAIIPPMPNYYMGPTICPQPLAPLAVPSMWHSV